jgi:tetratricopeptide (TPR) repeat protein
MNAIFSAALLAANILVSYSFDDQLTDTGPDTFAVFQNAKGHVRLVSQIRFSGYRSIELRDVAGDGDFPELQGYFPERKTGELFFHFAILVANPDQNLNVALAGPSHFTLTKDGIAFWLKTQNGVLHHVSDSIPKKLFAVEPFVWYTVDVRYDVAGGTYDLTIRREGRGAPLVELKKQPNAVNAPASSVDKFSFVGSVFEDDSNVTYYVDDVVIGTDENVLQGPFVAPGRRKLFVDRWREAQAMLRSSPRCPPMLSSADFGLDPRAKADDAPLVKTWRAGCAMMDDQPDEAAKLFARERSRHPEAPILAMSKLMALFRSGDRDAAMKRWSELEPLLQNDVRYGMIAAVADPSRAHEDRLDPDERYFVMLWKGELARAARFAEERKWAERTGDALFLSGAPALARKYYEQALRDEPNAYWPTVKLSDVFHLLGDTANEKVYRQKMYGRLEE